MSETVELAIKGDIEALHLRPGDVLVVTTRKRITVQQAEQIIEKLTAAIPGYKAVILPPELILNTKREKTDG